MEYLREYWMRVVVQLVLLVADCWTFFVKSHGEGPDSVGFSMGLLIGWHAIRHYWAYQNRDQQPPARL
jgi:hypothetical protein